MLQSLSSMASCLSKTRLIVATQALMKMYMSVEQVWHYLDYIYENELCLIYAVEEKEPFCCGFVNEVCVTPIFHGFFCI